MLVHVYASRQIKIAYGAWKPMWGGGGTPSGLSRLRETNEHGEMIETDQAWFTTSLASRWSNVARYQDPTTCRDMTWDHLVDTL